MMKVQVHRRVVGTYHHDCHCRIANPIRNQYTLHNDSVPVSEYETWVHLYVAERQHVQEYHRRWGTPRIRIIESRTVRHSLGIHGKAIPFAAVYVLAYDSTLVDCDSI